MVMKLTEAPCNRHSWPKMRNQIENKTKKQPQIRPCVCDNNTRADQIRLDQIISNSLATSSETLEIATPSSQNQIDRKKHGIRSSTSRGDGVKRGWNAIDPWATNSPRLCLPATPLRKIAAHRHASSTRIEMKRAPNRQSGASPKNQTVCPLVGPICQRHIKKRCGGWANSRRSQIERPPKSCEQQPRIACVTYSFPVIL